MTHSQFASAIHHFNAEQYREALLAFEACWHADRSETLRAFILLSNALNQLRLGLHEGPRRNLARAAELLVAAPDNYAGIGLAPVRLYVTALCDMLPAGAPAPLWAQIPRFQILHVPASSLLPT